VATSSEWCASAVWPIMCGVRMTFGSARSGLSLGSGSTAKQSSAAPAIAPERSAAVSAASSTMAPRATLTRIAEGFISAILPRR
jgi:hypothetical protein